MRKLGWAALLATLLASTAHAEPNYPSKPITFVVAFAPGGGTDTAARLVAKDLATELGQPIIVENRPGAGGAIGAAGVTRAAADGYTLLFGSGSELDVLTAVKATAPYDPLKDFIPITEIGTVSFVLATNPSLNTNSVGELIAYARANPGKLNFASFGIGSTNHLIGEAFARKNHLSLVHVPYKGSAAAVTDLLAGQVQLSFDTASVMIPLVRSGNLKGLATLSPERSPLAPELPTMAESGLSDFTFEGWLGVLAPRGTPSPIVDRLHAALTKVLRIPALIEVLQQRGVKVVGSTPAEFGAFMEADVAKWGAIARAAEIRIE
ncbi:tripartite-type tricarboxylate transporter receptor subunit TctC [Bradyrhizobium diazoefficiens]|uniref:tripartite tricarboxylate transporter substrate binding protein n=1 Tax=Bradyrhizobium diazoefficiens TaxID=1355477 RepID=UPI003515AF4A